MIPFSYIEIQFPGSDTTLAGSDKTGVMPLSTDCHGFVAPQTTQGLSVIPRRGTHWNGENVIHFDFLGNYKTLTK